MCDTLSPSRFPNLEQRRDEIARMSIAGKKGVSQKEMQEINDTVEALFPQTAPTPPPRQKIAKLRGKGKKNSASASNASSDRSKKSSGFRTSNGNSSNSDISYTSP